MSELYTDPIEHAWDSAIEDADPAFALRYANDILYSAERLGKTRSFKGTNRSKRTSPTGGIYAGHRPYDAGYPQHLDVVATLANKQPLSYNFYSRSAPDTLHIGLDLPERIDQNTGKYNLRKIGVLAMLLASGVATATNTQVAITLNDGENIHKLPMMPAVTAAYSAIDTVLHNDRTMVQEYWQGGSTHNVVEEMKAATKRSTDVSLLVTDALDGFSNDNKNFDWQESLQAMHYGMGDRLMVVQLTSPAQEGPIPGADQRLQSRAAIEIRKRYAEHMAELRAAQAIALEGIRVIRIDGYSNPEHPVPAILKFLTEAQ